MHSTTEFFTLYEIVRTYKKSSYAAMRNFSAIRNFVKHNKELFNIKNRPKHNTELIKHNQDLNNRTEINFEIYKVYLLKN